MKKTLRNIIAIPMAALMIASSTNVYNVYAKGDVQDRRFSISFNGKDDVVTTKLKKYDASPTYVYNDKSTGPFRVRVNVAGTSKCSNYVYCAKGDYVFIKSKGVKGESVFLQISLDNGKGTVSGLWSPDSINYSNVYK